MRKSLQVFTAFLLLQMAASAQKDSATYTADTLSTEWQNFISTFDKSWGCTDTLTVSIPAGNYVTGVDIFYQITADSNAWVSEQGSYLECLSTGNQEGGITDGDPNWDSAGTFSYARTNLQIATGTSVSGNIEFFLHAFRSFGNVPVCGDAYQYIPQGTWKIVVHHTLPLTCFEPDSLYTTNRTATSVDLGWRTGGAANWQIEYGPKGFAPGTGTLIGVGSNPYTLTGLSPMTDYDFRVRDSCGVNDVSFWSPMKSFQTGCLVASAPVTENFDGPNWTTGNGNFGKGTIDTCWERNWQSDFVFKSAPKNFTSTTTGPTADHTTGSGKWVVSERVQNSGAPYTATLSSPMIDVTALTVPELTFWYHMYGADIGDLDVEVSDDGGATWTNVFSRSGQQQTTQQAPWQQAIVSLSAFANDTIIVRFTAFQPQNGGSGDIALDDFDIHEQPTCPQPTNLAISNVTATTADVSWTTGGATNWTIEYGPAGFTLGNGTRISTATNPTTIMGLSPATSYDIYVRDSCAPTDLSLWTGPVAFSSGCAVAIAPFSQNFDGPNWIPGTGFGAQGSIDTCWTRNPITTYFWKPGPPQFVPGNTGPSGDHTTGNGKYIYTETSGGSTVTQTAELETPPIDVSGLTQPFLTFWYHLYGNNIGDLEVEISNNGGASFTNVFTLQGQQQFSNNDAWLEANVDLAAYAGDTIIIKFNGIIYNFGGASNLSLDDISVDEAPPCQKPSQLALNFVWIDFADLSWTAGSGTDWELEYGAPGFTLGTGTKVAANSNTNFKLSGLSPNTSYDVYVRDSCGIGNVSAWVGPISFTTLCQAVPASFSEDFEGAAWDNGGANTALGTIANCWVRDTTEPFVWKAGSPPNISGQTGPSADHTTGSGGWAYSERINFFGGGPAVDAYLQTPPVDLSTIATQHLNFWYHLYGNSVVGLEVDINDGSGWSQIFSLTGQQQTSGTDAWKEAIVNLSAYANDTVVIRWKSTNNNGGTNNDVAIDDVLIDTLPSCPKPTNFTVAGNTQNSVTLDWTTGGASDWNISYGAIGFNPNSGTIINASAIPFTVSGLSPNTAYSFYVRDSCAVGDVSPWVGPVTVLTDCLPQAAPFVENFDGAAWTLGTTGGGGVPGAVANCWRRDADSSYIWTAGQNGTPSGNTGPDQDNTSGNGKYVYTESYFGGFQGNVATLTTPLIDLGPLANPELKFFYHLYGADITTLEVRVFDGNSWTTEVIYNGEQQTAETDAWIEQLVDLVPFAGDTIKVEFRATKAVGFSPQADMAIDDLSIDEKPACPKPDSLISTGATATSIDLSWISGGASNWQVLYRQAGSTAPFTIAAAGTNPFTVTGLNPSTTYEFYVRDSCSAGVVSDSVGPVLANTLCLPIAAPYFENFDGANFDPGPAGFGVAGTIDACWTRNTAATYFWKAGPSTPQTGGTGASGDHTTGSGGYLFTESGGFAQPPLTAEITSPAIDLSPLTSPELTFWYHLFGAQIGDLEVEISNDGGATYTNLTIISGEQQTARTDAWLEQIIPLSAYAGDTVIIKFIGQKTVFGNGSDISIDDVEIDEAPNCPKPSNLITTMTTATSVTLSWTSGGATDWQIEYGAPGFVNGTGTIVAANSNPFTVTGLTPATAYDFYVRDSCGVGVTSDWSTVADDTTDCTVFTAPFIENFDGASWDSGPNGFGVAGDIDPCWERNRVAGYFWKAGPSTPQSGGTGPSADHTSGNGGYAFTESGGFLPPPQSANLETPSVDLGPLTAPELRFWYHMTGPGIGDLDVEISNDNGATFTNLTTISGQQQTAQTAPWLEQVLSLNAYQNDTVIVRFKGTKNQNNNQADIAIDDVAIIDSTGCERPDSVWAVSNTVNSITVGWNSPSMAAGAIIFYRPAGSTAPFSSVATTTNPSAISGLQPSTTYEIYVQDSCGVGAISLASSIQLFGTQCGAIAAPWSENFDNLNWQEGTGFQNNGDQIDPCWTRPSNTGIRWTAGAGATASANTGPSGDYNGGGNYIYTEASIGQGTSEIETPRIYLPTSLTSPKLEFWYHMYGQNITSLAVEIDDGTGYTNQLTITGQQQTSNAAAWLLDSVNLSAFSGDTIQIKFVGINATNFEGDIAVDQVSVTGTVQNCPDPTNISFANIGNTSIDVTWNSTSASSEIEVVPAGNAQGTGTLFTPVTSPFTITGLNASTAYDIYIRDICGGLFSNWINSSFTTTNCPAVVANFTFNANLLTVNFNSSATSGQDSLLWDFGNGNTANTAAPSQTYAAPGVYTVSLYAGNTCGNGDTLTQTITVCDSLIPNFTFTQMGSTVNFDASSSVGALFYYWDFGVGSDTGITTSFNFPTSGTKPVTLSVVNACGDSISITKNIPLCLPPVADWMYTILSSGGAGMQVQFDGTASQNATGYEWDFGDGSPLVTGQVLPIHTYLTPGLFYKVRLCVTNSCNEQNCKAFKLSQIGLAEISLAESLKLYPNPATAEAVLEWDAADFKIQSVEISDVSGKTIFRTEIPTDKNGRFALDLRAFPAGSYLIKIHAEQETALKQLMVR